MRLLSIGLPVYNGEAYVAEALDALLDQSFEDFELVICDNSSSDSTVEIVQGRISGDSRVRLIQHPENLGAAPNYNSTLELSEDSIYYAWVAHDDIPHRRFFEECINGLENRPDAVLAYTRTANIDEDGNQDGIFPSRPSLGVSDVAVRFGDAINQRNRNYPVFGVMRRDSLERTSLHGSYTGSDRTLVAEMALQGPFVEVESVLFGLREHAGKSVRQNHTGNSLWGREAWFDSSKEGRITFPKWKRFGYYLAGAMRHPRTVSERLKCLVVVLKWLIDKNWKTLILDLVNAVRRALWLLRRD